MALKAFRTFGTSLTGTPQQIIDAMFRQLVEWVSKPYWAGSGFTRLAMELADLPGHPARNIARRHKAVLEESLADILAKANVEAPKDRAREIWLLSEGAISLVLIHRDLRYAKAAGDAARRLIDFKPSPKRPRRRALTAPWTNSNRSTRHLRQALRLLASVSSNGDTHAETARLCAWPCRVRGARRRANAMSPHL